MHNVKHPSLIIQENILYLIYSSIEELSEKIVYRKINLDSSDQNKWKDWNLKIKTTKQQ